jgi:DNA-binding response OmpR family regulator
MDPLLCFPDPPPAPVSKALDNAGIPWRGVASAADAHRLEPEDGWTGAIVSIADDPEGAFALVRALRDKDAPLEPVLLVIEPGQLHEIESRAAWFDDFALVTSAPHEIEIRIARAMRRSGRGREGDIITYGQLALNVETYQAVISGRLLDLTYMEYELLRFLAAHPGKVFTREALLSRVWGYDYFGGARTVDVHVRRLRAKLGEEHSHLIETVRSVGYRFGRALWKP